MNVKYILTTGLFASILLIGTSTYANGEAVIESAKTTVTSDSKEKAGITPDSFFTVSTNLVKSYNYFLRMIHKRKQFFYYFSPQ